MPSRTAGISTLLALPGLLACTEGGPPAEVPRVARIVYFDDIPARGSDGTITYGGEVTTHEYDPGTFGGAGAVVTGSVTGIEIQIQGNPWPSEMQLWACPQKTPFNEAADIFDDPCGPADRVQIEQVLGTSVVTDPATQASGFYFENREIAPNGAEGTANWTLGVFLPEALRIEEGEAPAEVNIEIRNVSLNDELSGSDKTAVFLLTVSHGRP